MVRLGALLLFALTASGCSYFRARGEDFLDIWRGEIHAFGIPGAWVHAGPLAHTGLGIVRFGGHGPAPTLAHIYNYENPEDIGYPSGYFLGHTAGDWPGHERKGGEHHCFGLLPGLLHKGGQDRPLIHLFDIEVGAGFLLAGTNVGFSPGQFLDFLLGWCGVDIGNDDSREGRERRSGSPRKPEPPLPGGFRKGDCVELITQVDEYPAGTQGHLEGVQGKRPHHPPREAEHLDRGAPHRPPSLEAPLTTAAALTFPNSSLLGGRVVREGARRWLRHDDDFPKHPGGLLDAVGILRGERRKRIKTIRNDRLLVCQTEPFDMAILSPEGSAGLLDPAPDAPAA